jgi:hypothetical protein
MKFYTYDFMGVYVNEVDVDPMGPIPQPSTDVAPPQTTGTEVAQWKGTEWVVLPEYPVPPPAPLPSNAEQRAARQSAYQREADPIFFMFQREEATEQEWLDKITEIKERYPYYYDDKGVLLEAKD